MSRKAFTLIEIALVLIVLGILFPIVTRLFTTPAKYISDAEQCINYLDAKFNRYLFDSISWKWNTWSNANAIQIASFAQDAYHIAFSQLSGTQLKQPYVDFMQRWSWTQHIEGFEDICDRPSYRVMLSGAHLQEEGDNYINITIKKNLQGSYQDPAMTIEQYRWVSSLEPERLYKFDLQYLICPKNLDTDHCIHARSTRFNTTTQSIVTNKCLGIDRKHLTCAKRSVLER